MKKLILNSFHESKGAKFSPFAGWDMPISYGSSINEHLATREQVTAFDVSHMGEIEVKGKDSQRFLSFVLTQSIEKCFVGGSIYSPMCNHKGGTVDDLIAYKRTEDNFLLCVNASNTVKDFEHLKEHAKGFDCELVNQSSEFGQLAIQGPLSHEKISLLLGQEITKIHKMEFRELNWGGTKILVARTGYTGEDGFEIYCPSDHLLSLANALEELFQNSSSKWAGLAARDTLRLEAGFPLYGNELTDEISPLQAGLQWYVALDKDDFIGKHSLLRERQAGLAGKVRFYRAEGRRIPRSGMKVIQAGVEIGRVLSGGYSPSKQVPIGTVWTSSDYSSQFSSEVEVRGQPVEIKYCKPVLRELRKQK